MTVRRPGQKKRGDPVSIQHRSNTVKVCDNQHGDAMSGDSALVAWSAQRPS
jgi:hypothetical protein